MNPVPLPGVPVPLDDRCCWADLPLWQGQTALSAHHMVPRCLASGFRLPGAQQLMKAMSCFSKEQWLAE